MEKALTEYLFEIDMSNFAGNSRVFQALLLRHKRRSKQSIASFVDKKSN